MAAESLAAGGDVLARIAAAEIDVVARARRERPVSELRSAPLYGAPRRSLIAALARNAPAVIAECKRRSPSRGVLREPYRPVEIASGYESGGAAAISVLTNEEFFGGSLADLSAVRERVSIPVLRKDFVIDAYQMEEARAAGADAVLLIAAILEHGELRELIDAAAASSLDVLLEVHDEAELETAGQVGARLIGVNNRNLRTFKTDLATSERLASLMPPGAAMVAESGLSAGADLRRLMAAGVRAFLIGEAFMTAADPGAALAALRADARSEAA